MTMVNSDSRLLDIPARTLVKDNINAVRESVLRVLKTVGDTIESNGLRNPSSDVIVSEFEDVVSKAEQLSAAVRIVHFHQSFQSNLGGIERAIKDMDSSVLRLSESLSNAQNDIERFLYESAKPLIADSIGAKKIDAVDSKAVIGLAKNLSFTTSAPPGWHPGAGYEISFPFCPPAPDEERMRAGRLFMSLEKGLEGVAASTETLSAGENPEVTIVEETDSTNTNDEPGKEDVEEDSNDKMMEISYGFSKDESALPPPSAPFNTEERENEDLFDI